jgi:nicotinamide-nucleotide amidase
MRDQDVAERVVELLDGRTVATAESCTAGRISSALACVEHATDFLRGGLVAYQEEIKRTVLGVTAASVLSENAAEQMATGVTSLLHADVAVATTGVAGDEEHDGTPPGTVFIATDVNGCVTSRVHRFEGSPEDVCEQASRRALLDLVEVLDASQRRRTRTAGGRRR